MKTVYAIGGSNSQTGAAVTKRFGEITIRPFDKFDQIEEILKKEDDCEVATPVWNSHEGEIPKTLVWDHLLNSHCGLSDLWPAPIQFWLVSRKADKRDIKNLCSVGVAARQCSLLVAELGCEFIPCSSTIEALEKFRHDITIDAVLIAPNTPDLSEFHILNQATADPNNFTSFVLLTPPKNVHSSNHPNFISGISMPVITDGLTESQRELFSQLFRNVNYLSEIPRPLFVFDRSPSTVGLLFEGRELLESDILSAFESEAGDIAVHEELGSIQKLYSQEFAELMSSRFPDLVSSDFVLHEGKNACIFSCPPLGIFMHGYSKESAEPVFKFYITLLFNLWSDGLNCSPIENEFFRRYEDSWIEGADFIQFAVI